MKLQHNNTITFKEWDLTDLLDNLEYQCKCIVAGKSFDFDVLLDQYNEICKRGMFSKANIIINYVNINGQLNRLVSNLICHRQFDRGDLSGINYVGVEWDNMYEVELTIMPKEGE